jgi:hypothetical protein
MPASEKNKYPLILIDRHGNDIRGGAAATRQLTGILVAERRHKKCKTSSLPYAAWSEIGAR